MNFFASPADYLPVHTGMELFSVMISMMVFGLGWNLRHKQDNSHMAVLAATLLSVAVLDVAHILSYDGMPDFGVPSGAEKAINFWLLARFATAAGLFCVAVLPVSTWSHRRSLTIICGSLAVSLLFCWAGLYHEGWMPQTFVPGVGLTAFKIALEYALMAAYALTALLLLRRHVSEQVYSNKWLASAAWVLCLGESFFTIYDHVTDIFNLLGHAYKVIGYGLIYRAIFVEGVQAPYRALEEERGRLRLLVEQAPDAILLVDSRDLGILGANPAAVRLFGRSERELLDCGRLDELYAAEQPFGLTARESIRRALGELAKGAAVFGERRIVTARGELRDCEVRSIALPPQHDRPVIRASFLDVTDRKRAEAALEESEARLLGVLNSTSDGIVSLDQDQKIVVFNAAAARMFGIGAREALGQPVDRFIPERFRAAHAAQVQGFARNAGATSRRMGAPRQVMALRADGSEFPIEAFISRFVTHEQVGLTVVIRDVSEQRLVERQLQQAQKMETIGQLTGGMAHDFNNLLSVIQGNLDLLEERLPAHGAERRLAQSATRAVQRGAELTRALLAFARRQPLEPRRVDLAEVLPVAGQLFRRVLGEAVSLRIDLAEGIWPIRVDVAQFESALLNLAVNARDAMPAGGTLSIGARNLPLGQGDAALDLPPGDYVVIEASDTGAGMPPEVAARAFDPFFTTKDGKGTGLGLSMVHGFVRQSGGQTLIDSAPGRGTRVGIYLPRCLEAEPEATAEVPAAPAGSGGETVLVVEDYEDLRMVAERQIRSLGYRVVTAADARVALEVMKGGEAVDLLFTDIQMPGGMDGRALAAAARASQPGLRVLFTSGFADAQPQGGIEAGLLRKPYTKEQLARALRGALENGRTAPH